MSLDRRVKAQSEPSKPPVKWAASGRNLKRIKPKHKGAFVRGLIQHWEEGCE